MGNNVDGQQQQQPVSQPMPPGMNPRQWGNIQNSVAGIGDSITQNAMQQGAAAQGAGMGGVTQDMVNNHNPAASPTAAYRQSRYMDRVNNQIKSQFTPEQSIAYGNSQAEKKQQASPYGRMAGGGTPPWAQYTPPQRSQTSTPAPRYDPSSANPLSAQGMIAQALRGRQGTAGAPYRSGGYNSSGRR